MLRTLYSKLAAVLFGLFALVGIVSILGTLHFFQLYNEEANQRLNQPLARHLADQNLLLNLADANPARLRSMFDMQMIINPSIQIYLLDASGRIVGFSAAPGEVKLERVASSEVLGLVHDPHPLAVRIVVEGDQLVGTCECEEATERICRHQVALAHALWVRDRRRFGRLH